MHRTTIMLPDALRAQLQREAERDKTSFGELVRRALQKYLLGKQGTFAQDPFLSNQTVFQDAGPTDVAERHDVYLARDPH
ncbi:MAG: ribbon-helix-helix protein, CopG family [Deltaproteobacteria bacterium]|nr:ribbon-helix-helix protein, CopG family [Deltaproteobacteria bacterium]